jgi:epoxyqueuosine reductase
MVQALYTQLEERGYKGRLVSIQYLRALQGEIEASYRLGLFDEEFYQERLTEFKFSPPDSLPEARSLIVVAVPQPQIRVTFTWNEARVSLIVPPTYLHWRETDKRVEQLLAGVLRAQGYRVAQAALPKKLLAVHSGLGTYGRNNICYVDGMGSFHRLVALYSDFPCQEDNWQELRMMESCQNCSACLRHCPTGAITADRFLLHAERCLTFRNEKPGDVPFPTWLDPSWHNCLVGCMYCQRVCPQNKEFLGWVEEGAEFSAEETALLLQGAAFERLPTETVKRLQRFDLIDLLDVIPRNLGAFLDRGGDWR